MTHVSESRVIPAQQSKVWALLVDLANASLWNKSWLRIEFTSNQTHGVGTKFKAHTESGDAFEFEVSEWSAPDRLAIRPLRDPDEPAYQVTLDSHEFRLTQGAEHDETVVELRANATARGIKGRVVAALIWPGHQRGGLKTALDAIASVFDEDEPPKEPAGPSEPLSS
ncbi:MAG: SRPBCC family protein [Dehalococcoidia bacterium]